MPEVSGLDKTADHNPSLNPDLQPWFLPPQPARSLVDRQSGSPQGRLPNRTSPLFSSLHSASDLRSAQHAFIEHPLGSGVTQAPRGARAAALEQGVKFLPLSSTDHCSFLKILGLFIHLIAYCLSSLRHPALLLTYPSPHCTPRFNRGPGSQGVFKNCLPGVFCQFQCLGLCNSTSGERIQSLIKELGFPMPCGAAKN